MVVWRAVAVLLACSAASAAVDRDTYMALVREADSLHQTLRRLEFEEAYAAGPDTSAYMVLDLVQGIVAVKMGGVVLRRAPLTWVEVTDRGRAVVDTSIIVEEFDLTDTRVAAKEDSLGRPGATQADTLGQRVAPRPDSAAARLASAKGDTLASAADSLTAEPPIPVCQLTLSNGLRVRIAGAEAPRGSWANLSLRARNWLVRLVRPKTAPDVLLTVPPTGFPWVEAAASPGRRILVVVPGPSS